MIDMKSNQATSKLVQSVQASTKAFADTAVSTQEHALAFAQSVLEHGIEVLKSHAQSSRTLLQELVKQASNQQVGPETLQMLMDSTLAAQERNTQFVQSICANGDEVLKRQVSSARSLVRELEQQFLKQQDTFSTLAHESMDAYKDFLFAPLTSWQKALEDAEAVTVEEIQNIQQATQQGLETIRKAAHQRAAMTEKHVRSSPVVAKKTAE